MKTLILRFLALFRRRARSTPVVIDRYSNFREVGTWACYVPGERGEMEFHEGGKMLARTIKTVDDKGRVALKDELVRDDQADRNP